MRTAAKLRARMARSPGGWGSNDLDRLFRGFGFVMREGGKHRLYSHPTYPMLRATVPRGSPLATGHVESALKLLDRLDDLSNQIPEGAP